MQAASVPPSPATTSLSWVRPRSGIGMRTFTDIQYLNTGLIWRSTAPSPHCLSLNGAVDLDHRITPRLALQVNLESRTIITARLTSGKAAQEQREARDCNDRHGPGQDKDECHLPLNDAVFHRVDAHALLRRPLDPALDLLYIAIDLEGRPGDLVGNVGPADVRHQLEPPANLPDDRLPDQLRGEGELHAQPCHRATSRRDCAHCCHPPRRVRGSPKIHEEAGHRTSRAARQALAHDEAFSATGAAGPSRAASAASNDAMFGCTWICGGSTSATASCVFSPAPVMNATTSSSGSTRPPSTRRFRPATVTPPAVSAKMPSVSASRRMPATSSSSLTAAPAPVDSAMIFSV